jgi:hypothetical protein
MAHSLTDWLTDWLTPCSRALLEKLTVPQLVKKFPAFYGSRRFITAFTRARHLPLSWASSIQSMPAFYFLKIHFNFTLPPTSGSPKSSLRSPHQNYVCTSVFPHTFCTKKSRTPNVVTTSKHPPVCEPATAAKPFLHFSEIRYGICLQSLVVVALVS